MFDSLLTTASFTIMTKYSHLMFDSLLTTASSTHKVQGRSRTEDLTEVGDNQRADNRQPIQMFSPQIEVNQGLSQEMIKGSPNLLIVGPGWGLGSSHNVIWWNLAIIFYVRAQNRLSKRRVDGSPAKCLKRPPAKDAIHRGLSIWKRG